MDLVFSQSKNRSISPFMIFVGSGSCSKELSNLKYPLPLSYLLVFISRTIGLCSVLYADNINVLGLNPKMFSLVKNIILHVKMGSKCPI